MVKTNGGGTTVAGLSIAVVTAVAVGILLQRRVSIDQNGVYSARRHPTRVDNFAKY